MNAFNIVAGLVTIASLIATLWIYFLDRKRRAVENERSVSSQRRLGTLVLAANAATKQTTLLGSMADREETSKKELKHLTVAVLYSLEILQRGLREEMELEREWRFGVPSHYSSLVEAADETGEVRQNGTSVEP